MKDGGLELDLAGRRVCSQVSSKFSMQALVSDECHAANYVEIVQAEEESVPPPPPPPVSHISIPV